jgi:hypothetical protein
MLVVVEQSAWPCSHAQLNPACSAVGSAFWSATQNVPVASDLRALALRRPPYM